MCSANGRLHDLLQTRVTRRSCDEGRDAPPPGSRLGCGARFRSRTPSIGFGRRREVDRRAGTNANFGVASAWERGGRPGLASAEWPRAGHERPAARRRRTTAAARCGSFARSTRNRPRRSTVRRTSSSRSTARRVTHPSRCKRSTPSPRSPSPRRGRSSSSGEARRERGVRRERSVTARAAIVKLVERRASSLSK